MIERWLLRNLEVFSLDSEINWLAFRESMQPLAPGVAFDGMSAGRALVIGVSVSALLWLIAYGAFGF